MLKLVQIIKYVSKEKMKMILLEQFDFDKRIIFPAIFPNFLVKKRASFVNYFELPCV